MVNISTSGLISQSVLQIKQAQAILGDLSGQLSTGKKSLDLGEYTLAENKRILDFRAVIEKRESFLNVIDTVQPRLKVYNDSLDSMTGVLNDAMLLVNTTQNYEVGTNQALQQQLDGFIDQVEYLLNQKMGDRYLFSGSRYTTTPVSDLNALGDPTGETIVTNPTLPAYDTQAPGNSAGSYFEDTARVDEGFTVTYGLSSNDPAIQNLILGLRWAKQATQDPSNFSTNIANAQGYLNTALTGIRGLAGEVASNSGRLDNMKKLHQSFISDLNGQISNIQGADSAEVATKITFVQAQLQASYSATAKIAQLSITNYL
jgi:flagellar hook-associated protein 3 FlgL